MFTERRAIEDEMQTIRRQMEFLWERKSELRKRLREIDERDMNEQVSPEILRSLTESLTDAISRLSELIPPVQVNQVIEHISKDINKEQIIPATLDSKKDDIQDKIEQESRKQQEAAPPIKLSRERSASLIKEILIEAGEPMKFPKIEQEFFRRTNKKFANFYEQVRFATEKFPKIKKLGRGLYVYEEDKPSVIEDSPSIPENRELQTV